LYLNNYEHKESFQHNNKKQLDIDVSDSGLLIYSLAPLVTELYFDGGNEIYAQLIPFWDGEDDVFDIESLTEEDICQLPNLKVIDGTAIFMSEEVRNLCKSKGISFADEPELMS
jgi:hypothetical protein